MSMLTAVMLAGLTAAESRAERVDEQEHGFSFEPPLGFVAMQPAGKALHTYSRGTEGEPEFQVITFEPLGSTLGENIKLDPKIVESAARKAAAGSGVTVGDFKYEKVPWRTHQLDLLASKMSRGEIELVTFATLVPLSNGAIQLATAGHSADARTTHPQVLTSIKGRSNWRSSDEKLGFVIGQVVGFALCPLMLIGIAVVVVVVVRKRRSKPTA